MIRCECKDGKWVISNGHCTVELDMHELDLVEKTVNEMSTMPSREQFDNLKQRIVAAGYACVCNVRSNGLLTGHGQRFYNPTINKGLWLNKDSFFELNKSFSREQKGSN